jgi:hypothetical protein
MPAKSQVGSLTSAEIKQQLSALRMVLSRPAPIPFLNLVEPLPEEVVGIVPGRMYHREKF